MPSISPHNLSFPSLSKKLDIVFLSILDLVEKGGVKELYE